MIMVAMLLHPLKQFIRSMWWCKLQKEKQIIVHSGNIKSVLIEHEFTWKWSCWSYLAHTTESSWKDSTNDFSVQYKWKHWIDTSISHLLFRLIVVFLPWFFVHWSMHLRDHAFLFFSVDSSINNERRKKNRKENETDDRSMSLFTFSSLSLLSHSFEICMNNESIVSICDSFSSTFDVMATTRKCIRIATWVIFLRWHHSWTPMTEYLLSG